MSAHFSRRISTTMAAAACSDCIGSTRPALEQSTPFLLTRHSPTAASSGRWSELSASACTRECCARTAAVLLDTASLAHGAEEHQIRRVRRRLVRDCVRGAVKAPAVAEKQRRSCTQTAAALRTASGRDALSLHEQLPGETVAVQAHTAKMDRQSAEYGASAAAVEPFSAN